MLCSELIEHLQKMKEIVGDKRIVCNGTEECYDVEEIRYIPSDDEIFVELKAYEW